MSTPVAIDEEKVPDLKLESITDGQNDRGIPMVKFLDDIGAFSKTFDPPASAELLIGAYSDIFAKFKSYEGSLAQKRELHFCIGNCVTVCPHPSNHRHATFIENTLFLTLQLSRWSTLPLFPFRRSLTEQNT